MVYVFGLLLRLQTEVNSGMVDYRGRTGAKRSRELKYVLFLQYLHGKAEEFDTVKRISNSSSSSLADTEVTVK